jgi:hypothetical protein
MKHRAILAYLLALCLVKSKQGVRRMHTFRSALLLALLALVPSSTTYAQSTIADTPASSATSDVSLLIDTRNFPSTPLKPLTIPKSFHTSAVSTCSSRAFASRRGSSLRRTYSLAAIWISSLSQFILEIFRIAAQTPTPAVGLSATPTAAVAPSACSLPLATLGVGSPSSTSMVVCLPSPTMSLSTALAA